MRAVRSLALILFIVVLITQMGAASIGGQTPLKSGIAKRLVGTWRLVSVGPADRQNFTGGSNPTGLMVFDGLGNMAVQIMPDRPRPKYSGAEPTPGEAKEAIAGYSAYWGTYTIDERAQTVTQHRKGSLNPGDVGGDAVRTYEFLSDDRLMLTTVPGGNKLTWQRMK